MTGGAAKKVVIQLKGHPTFVSDAMSKDMLAMIDLLADVDEKEYPRCAFFFFFALAFFGRREGGWDGRTRPIYIYIFF